MIIMFSRQISYIRILLFITVASIVVLDIRFHLNSNPRGHSTRKSITATITDQTVEQHFRYDPNPPYDKTHRRNSSTRKFRQIAYHDMPPESKSDWAKGDDEVPVSRFPKCLLVGFSKCGTSSLLAFLNLHPNIVSLDWETDYFCDRVYFKYSLHWYRMRMPVSTSNQVTIEKSPCYISEKQALERIRAFNSTIKILVIVREPLTRITSEHGQYLVSFKASDEEKISIEDRYINPKTGKLRESLINKWGVFAPRMENLFAVFPREQIYLVDGDKFIKDPISTLTRVEQFLGLQSYFSAEDVYFDPSKGFYCPRDRKTKQTECMGRQKGREHVDMSWELRQRLQDYLRPFNERLFDVIGHVMNWDRTHQKRKDV